MREDALNLWMTLWALITAIGQGFAAVALAFGAMATGMVLFALVPLLFFGIAAVAAALHVGPIALRRAFARFEVRPGTWQAVLMVLLSTFHWIAAAGVIYALFANPVPEGISDGMYYLLMPVVIVVVAGGGYFIATFERLRLSGAPNEEVAS